MYVGFDLSHYLIEVLDVVMFQAFRFHGLLYDGIEHAFQFHRTGAVQVKAHICGILDDVASDCEHSVETVVLKQ